MRKHNQSSFAFISTTSMIINDQNCNFPILKTHFKICSGVDVFASFSIETYQKTITPSQILLSDFENGLEKTSKTNGKSMIFS